MGIGIKSRIYELVALTLVTLLSILLNACSSQVTNYWPGEPPNAISPQPLPFMKGMRHGSRGPHMRVMDPVRCRDDREKTPEEDTTTTIGKCYNEDNNNNSLQLSKLI